MRLTDWLDRREERGGDGLDGPELSPETSAIVVGYGRFGQTVAQMLMAKGIGGHADRQEAEQIETGGRVRHQGLLWRRHCGSTCCASPGAETAKAILFCNDNHDGD